MQISCSRDLVHFIQFVRKGRACALAVGSCDSTDAYGVFQRVPHDTLRFPEPEPEDADGESLSSEEEEFVEADVATGSFMPMHVVPEEFGEENEIVQRSHTPAPSRALIP